MAQEKKEDMVCAFHEGLETLIKDIGGKVDTLRLSNAKMMGGFVVLNILSIVILRLLKVV